MVSPQLQRQGPYWLSSGFIGLLVTLPLLSYNTQALMTVSPWELNLGEVIGFPCPVHMILS